MLIYIVWLHKVIYAHFYCKAREASPETCSKVPLFAVHVFLSPGSLTAQSLIVDRANLNIKAYYSIVLWILIASTCLLYDLYIIECRTSGFSKTSNIFIMYLFYFNVFVYIIYTCNVYIFNDS